MNAWHDAIHAPTNDMERPPGLDSLHNVDSSKPEAITSNTTKFIRFADANKILYPMRRIANNPETAETASTKWSGLTPLDMVQQIVSMALDSQKLRPTLAIPERMHSGRAFLQYLANESEEDAGVAVGQKRKRAAYDEGYETISEECEIVLGSVLDDRSNFSTDVSSSLVSHWKPSVALEDWRLSHIHAIDRSQIDDGNAIIQLKHLDSIVERFEQQLTIDSENKWCIPSYNRIQSMFSSNMTYLLHKGSVHLLLEQATEQMQALIEMTRSRGPKASAPRVKFSNFVWCQDGSKRPIAKPNPIRIMQGIILPQSPLSEKTKKHIFGLYLTEWICQSRNWVNPYPDETVLKQMASHFIHLGCIPGTCHGGVVTEADAIDKINNWFVNTRTRQWRPAIEEAFDAKRPAMLLMEDSMRIFREMKLRPLIGWDGNNFFAQLGDYAEPVATWDMKGSKSSAKKRHGHISSKTYEGYISKPSAEKDDNIRCDNSLFPQVQSALAATLDEYGLMADDLSSHDYLNKDVTYFEEV